MTSHTQPLSAVGDKNATEQPRDHVRTMFVVILTYQVGLDRIQHSLAEHLAWLGQHYESGLFLASGAQVPRTGGVIIARGSTKMQLRRVLALDPFSLRGYAEYTVLEFKPSMIAPNLSALLG